MVKVSGCASIPMTRPPFLGGGAVKLSVSSGAVFGCAFGGSFTCDSLFILVFLLGFPILNTTGAGSVLGASEQKVAVRYSGY